MKIVQYPLRMNYTVKFCTEDMTMRVVKTFISLDTGRRKQTDRHAEKQTEKHIQRQTKVKHKDDTIKKSDYELCRISYEKKSILSSRISYNLACQILTNFDTFRSTTSVYTGRLRKQLHVSAKRFC